MTEKGWASKEKREIFRTVCNTFVMKTGSDKDPIMEKVMEYAKMVADKAFELYPNEEEEGGVEFEFEEKK